MEEFKGTKGTWYAQQGVDQMVSDDTTVFMNLGDYWHIFSTAPKKGDIKANVQLIASAPELLEVLQDFVKAIDNEEIVIYDNIDHDGFSSTPNKLYENAQKAINKALGK